MINAVACSIPDEVQPSSSLVTHHQVGEKLHLQIHSTEPLSQVCHERGQCITVREKYYSCISMAVFPGETITVSDGTEIVNITTEP